MKFRFRIALSVKEIVLLCTIKIFITNSGTLSLIRADTKIVTLEINNIDTIKFLIIPFFFETYPLKGLKQLDYLDWRDAFF